MPGEFEKRIQQQIKKFHLSPPGHVWEDIAVVLSKTKRSSRLKRVVAAGMLVLCLGVTAIVVSKKANKSLPANSNYTATAKVNENIPSLNATAGKKRKKTNWRLFSTLNFSKEKKNKINDGSDHYPDNKLIDNEALFNNKNSFEKAELVTPDNLQVNNTTANSNIYYNMFRSASIKGVIQEENVNPFTTGIFTNTSLAAKDQHQQTITPNIHGFIRNRPVSNNIWSVIIAAGTTNTIQKNLFFKTKKDLIYRPDPTASNPSPTPDTLKYLRRSYYGYHVTAGLQFERKLSKHWSVYTGLQYSYLTNQQKIGKKYNGIFNISQTIDTTSGPGKPFIKVPYHYVDGLSGTLTNSASWIEIPLSAGYTFNPSSKIKLQIKSGFTVAYMFNYLWLIADGRYSKFYYSPALTNNWIVNWHGDAAVEFKNKMVAGLRLKRSLSPVANSTVQPSLYWNNFSVYTTIPLH